MGAKRTTEYKKAQQRARYKRQPVQRQEPPRLDTDGQSTQELRVAERLNEMTARKKAEKSKKTIPLT